MNTTPAALRALKLLAFVKEYGITLSATQLGYLMELVEEFVKEEARACATRSRAWRIDLERGYRRESADALADFVRGFEEPGRPE